MLNQCSLDFKEKACYTFIVADWDAVDYFIGILVLLFLLLMGLFMPGILLSEFLLRPRKMKQLAEGFSLSYKKNDGLISESGRRNVITGGINAHHVKIYDYGAPNYEAKETYFTDLNVPIRSKRFTAFSIDGKEEILTGKISGYCPVSKIREKLISLTQK